MKNTTKFTSVALFALGAASFLNAQTVLIDFGSDNSFRGASVAAGADANGNYWNSVDSSAFFENMVGADGVATTIDLGFDASPIPVGGSDYFNGPSGGTADPSAIVINAGALGDLGINEAVYDYYASSAFQLQGFTAGDEVELTFFGSHRYNTENTTRYATYTDTDFTTIVDSVDLLVGVNNAYNQDTTASLTTTVGANGIIYIAYDGATGSGSGYLNAMQASVVPEPGTYALLAGLSALAAIAMRRRRV